MIWLWPPGREAALAGLAKSGPLSGLGPLALGLLLFVVTRGWFRWRRWQPPALPEGDLLLVMEGLAAFTRRLLQRMARRLPGWPGPRLLRLPRTSADSGVERTLTALGVGGAVLLLLGATLLLALYRSE